MTKDFRFGVNMFTGSGSRSVWHDAARRVEDLGYDVLLVPDHLGTHAPFPALVSAAEATTRLRTGTLVLNAGFYNPVLLARDVAEVHELTDGRFELGLGAGWAAEEFETAGMPFPGARDRVDHLEHTVTKVGDMLREAGHRMPLLVGGQGERVLTLAARHGDIVNISDTPGAVGRGRPNPVAERIDVVRRAAGERFDQLELCVIIQLVHITGTGAVDLTFPRRIYPGVPDEDLVRLPGVRHGSPRGIADSLRELRETHGISYFIAMDVGGNLEAFGKVISQLR